MNVHLGRGKRGKPHLPRLVEETRKGETPAGVERKKELELRKRGSETSRMREKNFNLSEEREAAGKEIPSFADRKKNLQKNIGKGRREELSDCTPVKKGGEALSAEER